MNTAKQQMRLARGALVEASDGRYGVIDDVVLRPGTQQVAHVLVRTDEAAGPPVAVPVEVIRGVRYDGTIELGLARADITRYAMRGWQDWQAAAVQQDTMVVPIVEERLVPEKREMQLGEVLIQKHVESADEALTLPVTRDDLEIERVKVDRPLDAPAAVRYEGDWMVIPVMKEVLVVEKQLVLAEELRIRKRQVTETREYRATLRHERVEVTRSDTQETAAPASEVVTPATAPTEVPVPHETTVASLNAGASVKHVA